MDGIVEFFSHPIAQFPAYPWWLYVATMFAIVGLTEAIKLPIKHFTDKIENETKRKRVNIVIMFIPLALAFGANAIYMIWGYGFSVSAAVVWGETSQVLYLFLERIFKRVNNKEKITEETLKKDFKDSVAEADAAYDELQKAKKTKADEFDELVEKYKK